MEARETDDIEGMPLLPFQVSPRIIGIKKTFSLKKNNQKWIIKELTFLSA